MVKYITVNPDGHATSFVDDSVLPEAPQGSIVVDDATWSEWEAHTTDYRWDHNLGHIEKIIESATPPVEQPAALVEQPAALVEQPALSPTSLETIRSERVRAMATADQLIGATAHIVSGEATPVEASIYAEGVRWLSATRAAAAKLTVSPHLDPTVEGNWPPMPASAMAFFARF